MSTRKALIPIIYKYLLQIIKHKAALQFIKWAKDLNNYIMKEGIQIVHKYIKNYLTLLFIREMQI